LLEFLVPSVQIIGKGGFSVFHDDLAPFGPVDRQGIEGVDEPILNDGANHPTCFLIRPLAFNLDVEIIVSETIRLVPVQMVVRIDGREIRIEDLGVPITGPARTTL
jgi:hypothetical protein